VTGWQLFRIAQRQRLIERSLDGCDPIKPVFVLNLLRGNLQDFENELGKLNIGSASGENFDNFLRAADIAGASSENFDNFLCKPSQAAEERTGRNLIRTAEYSRLIVRPSSSQKPIFFCNHSGIRKRF